MKLTFGQRAALLMQIVKGSLDVREGSIAGSLLKGLWPSTSGEPPKRQGKQFLDTYNQMPWARAPVARIASAVAGLTWRLYYEIGGTDELGRARARRNPQLQRMEKSRRKSALTASLTAGKVREVESHILLDALHDGNAMLAGQAMWKVSSSHMDLVGETFWMKERNAAGAPVAFWPLPTYWVIDTPTLSHRFYKVSFRAWQGEIPDSEIVWFKDPDPANPYGRGSGSAQALADELEMDEYACHDEQTECLTRRGWVAWPNVTVHDELATWSEERGRLEYQRPSEVHCYEYQGSLHHWKGRSIDAMVTPNHRMWMNGKVYKRPAYPSPFWHFETSEHASERLWAVQRFWRDAARYEGKQATVYIEPVERITKRKPGSRGGGRPPAFGVNDPLIFKARDFARFLGYVVSEGHMGAGGVHLCQNEGAFADDIRNVLSLFPKEWVRERKTVREWGLFVRWSVLHLGLAEWFRKHVCHGAENKRARLAPLDPSKLAAILGVVFQVRDKKVVRYHGEAVLALAAPSPQAAEDALHAVAMTFEVLPHVVTLDEAMADGAPLVFEKPVEERRTAGDAPGGAGAVAQKGNVRGPRGSGRGEKDLSRLFAESDGVVELTVRTQVQTHACMETHALFAEWKGDELFVVASTQGIFSVRDELAQVFGIPKDKVHVTGQYVGGGFGSKFGAGDYGVFAAQLARKAGRPVKLILDRKEDQLAAGNRPDSMNRMKVAYRKDGTVTAFEYVSHGTAGVATGAGTGSVVKNSYAFPNVKVEEFDVFTHLGPGCAMRAPGHPQGTLAVEAALDEIASRLGKDPLAVRLANDPMDVRRAEWERGAEAIRWDRRAALSSKNREAAAKGLPLRRGLGCAASVWYNIVSAGSQVIVRIHRDGNVEVENGVQEIGCGNPTTIAVTVAEELVLAPEAIRVKWGSTAYPFGPASGGSTTTPSLIPAVRVAAWNAAGKLKALAAPLLGAAAAGDVVVGGGTSAPAGRASHGRASAPSCRGRSSSRPATVRRTTTGRTRGSSASSRGAGTPENRRRKRR